MHPEPRDLQALTSQLLHLYAYCTTLSKRILQHNKTYFGGFIKYNPHLSPAAVKPGGLIYAKLTLIHTATYCPTTETTYRNFSQIQTIDVHFSLDQLMSSIGSIRLIL